MTGAPLTLIQFVTVGTPVTQGSMKIARHGLRNVIVHDDSPALKAWRHSVGEVARHVMDRRGMRMPWTVPVAVVLEFTLPRPATVSRELPYLLHDLDKLTRAVLDALTGVVWRDDGQVCNLVASKRYGSPGVRVRVDLIEDEEPPTVRADLEEQLGTVPGRRVIPFKLRRGRGR